MLVGGGGGRGVVQGSVVVGGGFLQGSVVVERGCGGCGVVLGKEGCEGVCVCDMRDI